MSPTKKKKAKAPAPKAKEKAKAPAQAPPTPSAAGYAVVGFRDGKPNVEPDVVPNFWSDTSTKAEAQALADAVIEKPSVSMTEISELPTPEAVESFRKEHNYG